MGTIESPEQVALETTRTWLTEIDAASGYHTDCAGRVFFDRPADRDTPLPFIILDDDLAEFNGKVIRLNAYIIGVLPLSEDSDEKRAGRRFLWDVRRCLRQHSRRDPLTGFEVQFLEQSIEEPEDQSALLIPTLHVVLSFPDNEIKARY